MYQADLSSSTLCVVFCVYFPFCITSEVCLILSLSTDFLVEGLYTRSHGFIPPNHLNVHWAYASNPAAAATTKTAITNLPLSSTPRAAKDCGKTGVVADGWAVVVRVPVVLVELVDVVVLLVVEVVV